MTILGKNIKITSIILLFLSLMLTSCFDVIQDVAVKENGSGNFTLTINLSKSKSQISKILAQGSIQGFNIPTIQGIEQKLSKLNNELSKLNGISNNQVTKDFENYIFKIHFDFKHIDNINKAQIELAKLDGRIGQPLIYSYSEDFLSEVIDNLIDMKNKYLANPKSKEFGNQLKTILGKTFTYSLFAFSLSLF